MIGIIIAVALSAAGVVQAQNGGWIDGGTGPGKDTKYDAPYIYLEGDWYAPSVAAKPAAVQEQDRQVRLEDGAVAAQFASSKEPLDVIYLQGEWISVMVSSLDGKDAVYWPLGQRGAKARFVIPGETGAASTPFGPVAGPKLREKVELGAGLALVVANYESAIAEGVLRLVFAEVSERAVLTGDDGGRIEKIERMSAIECRRVDQTHMICRESFRDDEKKKAGVRYFGLRRDVKGK